jgi:hypothetical protein
MQCSLNPRRICALSAQRSSSAADEDGAAFASAKVVTHSAVPWSDVLGGIQGTNLRHIVLQGFGCFPEVERTLCVEPKLRRIAK